jgi:predicted metal-dependent HD superfamily phosphohydrolase
MKFVWSKIQETELSRVAKTIICKNLNLSYHNMLHIQTMYQYLHDTNEPYDEALDWSILFHDIVYDKEPDKELRSAVMFSDLKENYKGCDFGLLDEGHVASLIMSTKDHIVQYPSQSPIIRADLHGLSNPVSTFYNYYSIMQESMILYDIDEKTFAGHSEQFMQGLYERVEKNKTLDKDHIEFYDKVLSGIGRTIELSWILKGL